MNWSNAMKHIVPGALHVIIAARHQDGAVGVFYTNAPRNWLVALGEHCELDQVEVRPGAAAAKVTEHLRARFARAHIPSEALPWYMVDFDQAIAALEEFDLERGTRVANRGVRLEDRVHVANLGRGTVEGFTSCGRVKVRLDREDKLAAVVALAPRSALKPVLRAVSC